ncbi:MAG TPA: hypothetical protein LFW20_05240 [Rickettsia endosymbiont of Omalisus fontisbellaquei]|nr:hypothetical protein [Rickettsia endosymbiont of Omalisus fontisbellaquei]
MPYSQKTLRELKITILACQLSSSESDRMWLNMTECYLHMERDKRRQVLSENRKKRHKKIKPDDEQVKELSLDAQKNRLEECSRRKNLEVL